MDVQYFSANAQEWQVFADNCGAALQQRWSYGEAVRQMGGTVSRVEIRDGRRVIAIAQAVHRKIGLPLTLVTRGPLWTETLDPDRMRAAFKSLRTAIKGPLFITPASAEPIPNRRFWPVMTAATTAHLRLKPDLRGDMHGKWRNRLSFANRSGLDTRLDIGRRCNPNWLLDADRHQQKVKRYRSLPSSFTKSWQAADPKNILMISARREGRNVAAMLFLRHGNAATYHVGWTSDEGRRTSAHHLTLYRAAEWLCANGVHDLDLGLVNTVDTPGLARFKLGTGAAPVATGGTWLGI